MKNRLQLIFVGFLCIFMTLGWRLTHVVYDEYTDERTARTQANTAYIDRLKKNIFDREGQLLAITLPTYSVYVRPHEMPEPKQAIKKLLSLWPSLDKDQLTERIFQKGKKFAWIKRDIGPKEYQAFLKLGIAGAYAERESKRFYPYHHLGAHIVGTSDTDDKGLSGIERNFNTALRSHDTHMSIDMRLQYLMRTILSEGIKEFKAIGGAGIVLDAHSGEVLASVSLPDFDPHHIQSAAKAARFNRTTLGVYEPGSVAKILTTGLALDQKIVTLSDGYDTRIPVKSGGYTIKDYKPKNRFLNVAEIFMYSSNIGSANMAKELGNERYQRFYKNLGMLDPLKVEIIETSKPLVPSRWREIHTLTMSYGHGIAITPMHMVQAVAAMVNGGLYRDATFIKGNKKLPLKVISPETSQNMRQLLRLIVTHGTGKKANAVGYAVGGKTGTAEKNKGGVYEKDKNISSFMAAFPLTNPEYIVFIMLDEPVGNKKTYGYATGGWVAAPLIKKYIEAMAPIVGIPPIDEDAAPVQNLLTIEGMDQLLESY